MTDFPTIDPDAVPVTALAEQPGKLDLTKIDLTDVALAAFEQSHEAIATAKEKLEGVVHDLSTPTKLADAKSLRNRLINVPLADARKVSANLKSKLTAVSKAVGAELAAIETAFDEAAQLITPQIEAREAEIAEEKRIAAEKEAARVEKHRANLAKLAGYVEQARGLPSSRISAGIEMVKAIVLDQAAWEEFYDRAVEQKAATLERMGDMHGEALAAEAEARRRAEEKAEQERKAAELKAEADRLAAERAELDRARAEIEAARAAAAAEAQARADEAARLALQQAQAQQQTQVAAAPAPTADEPYRASHADAQSEIDGIRQQLAIAVSGRLGVRVGGTVECIRETLAETEAWVIGDHLGIYKGAAQFAKDETVAQIRAMLFAAEQKAATPAAAPAPEVRPFPAPAAEAPTMTLGALNARLGFTVSADFLESLGFVAHREKSARLYRPSQFPAICAGISAHVLAVAGEQKRAA
jgi:hypothetical protein